MKAAPLTFSLPSEDMCVKAIRSLRLPSYRNFRRRTDVQQLTCNIDLSCSFYYYLFFSSFVLIELKPFVLKGGKVLGENSEKVRKKCEQF